MINRKDKIKELLENLQKLRRAIVSHHPELDKIPRITPSQWSALMYIDDSCDNAIKDIAKSLNITSSAATQLIDGLVESGYVTKTVSKDDKRSICLKLSRNMENHVKKIKKDNIKKTLDFFKVLNDDEFENYVLMNKKIVDKILKLNY